MPPTRKRVSRMRFGGGAVKMPELPGTEAALHRPPTSTTTSVSSAWLATVTLTLVPSLAVTRSDTVSPAAQFRWSCWARPCLVAVVLVTATLSTAASTPETGTPPRPTLTFMAKTVGDCEIHRAAAVVAAGGGRRAGRPW